MGVRGATEVISPDNAATNLEGQAVLLRETERQDKAADKQVRAEARKFNSRNRQSRRYLEFQPSYPVGQIRNK